MPGRKNPDELTQQQLYFCEEYLIDLNATRAYKRAYPHVKNDNSAASSAAQLLRKPKIKRYIDKKITERNARTQVSQDRVIQELAAIAFADYADFVQIGTGGRITITETAEQSEAQRRAIAQIKETRDGLEIKLHEKIRALELLGRHLGMFKDRLEITPSVSAAAQKIAAILEEGEDDEPGASSQD